MAGVYLLVALFVLVTQPRRGAGRCSAHIVGNAFGFAEVGGGVAGGVAAAMLNGVKRGLFSNEAGMGSAPNIAAAATPVPHHPSSQGFVQALGVFIDTLVICSCTALMILLSGVYVPGRRAHRHAADPGGDGRAHRLRSGPTSSRWRSSSSPSPRSSATTPTRRWRWSISGSAAATGLLVLRCVVLLMVVWGALQAVATVFNTADASMGLMATINLIAIVALSGTVVKLTRDYFAQRAAGLEPRFHGDDHPELGDRIDHTIWTREWPGACVKDCCPWRTRNAGSLGVSLPNRRRGSAVEPRRTS